VQCDVFWSCHPLHAQNFRGVIAAYLAEKYIISNALLGRQSTEYVSVQFRATFVTFSVCGVLLLRPASTKTKTRRYEAWGPFFRRVPTNKVLDAMMRGRHLCGMGTATATCCHQPGRTERGSSTRAPMRTLNATHRAPATTRLTAVTGAGRELRAC